MQYPRRASRSVKVGSVTIGGGAPISVQSMTNTDTRDAATTLRQVNELAAAGCEIVRVAVPDQEAAEALGQICRQAPVPIVADIHFDYRLALAALAAGAHGLRLNPGNIGGPERVQAVARAACERGVPIRVGVNAGSLEKAIREREGGVTASGMVESALAQARLLEEAGLSDIVISLKASDVPLTIAAYELAAERCDYPLHLGITEAGTPMRGTIRSAVGLGALLARGIGDTIRVSLTGDPVEEVQVGYEILKALNLRQRGPVLISCPTCGRCEVNLIGLAQQVEQAISGLDLPLKIAVMGCVVNGPGEAAEADFGVAGGRGRGLIFRQGQVVRNVTEEELVPALLAELEAAYPGPFKKV
ncbi:MAG: flavodoxin-dependent (E)-4-hydroxy-3-methylbut-2-enyl-diphosphate synthase [Firmicutes bacterium]|nr:flavodoxin-dependent (E)-4-hydroxy-3-methylbut-2-enyl-diphosphate synthase [Bacillota bacterium]